MLIQPEKRKAKSINLKVLALIFLFGMCHANSGLANSSNNQLQKLEITSDLLECIDDRSSPLRPLCQAFFSGYTQGIANTLVITKNTKWCPPRNLIISGELALPLVRSLLKEDPYYASQLPAISIFEALMRTFPCV